MKQYPYEVVKQYPHVIVDIYEQPKYPVVSHIFYGETIEEARGYLKSHMKTDSFMRAAVNTGYFKGMRVKVGISEMGG
jgi:hypothetical protein